MRARVFLVLVVVAVLGGIVLLRSEREPPSRESSVVNGDPLASDARSPEIDDGDPSKAKPVPVAISSDESASAPLAMATVVVHVTHAGTGEPVEGLEVTGRSRHPSGRWEDSAGRTNAEGRVQWTLEAGSTLWGVRVLPGDTTTAARPLVRHTLRAAEEHEVEISVGEGGTLRGRVVDDSERAVPFARVACWFFGTQTGAPHRQVDADATGRFEMPHLGKQFVISAHTDQLACKRGLRGELADGQTVSGLKIHLTESFTIAGVVLDPQRREIAGVHVKIAGGLGFSSSLDVTGVSGVTYFWAGHGEAVTTASGRFEIGPLARIPHTVYGRHEPYLAFRQQVHPSSGEVEIMLDRGIRFSGRVHDRWGKGAHGAEVRWGPYWGNVYSTPQTTTCDVDGYFEFTGLAASDNLWVGVVHEGHALHIEQPVTIDGEPTLDVEIQLEEEQQIAGIVVNGAGKPLGGVRVKIEGDREMTPGASHGTRPTWEWCLRRNETQTDPEGRFLFANIYDGAFEVRAFDPARPHLSSSVAAEAGNLQLRIVVDADAESMRRVVLTGTVEDGLTGEPIRSFQVIPMIDGQGQYREFDDDEGRFEVDGLEAGAIQLSVRAVGYAASRYGTEDYEPGVHEFAVKLYPERSVDLVVTNREGKPVRKARIHVGDADGNTLRLRVGPGGSTDAVWLRGGRATLHGLPAAIVSLEFSQIRGAPGSFSHPLDLRVPLTEKIHIEIEAPDLVLVPILVFEAGQVDAAAPSASHPTPLPITRSARIVIRSAAGALHAEIKITPTDAESYVVEIDYPDGIGEVTTMGAGLFFSVLVPRVELSIEVEADGYEPWKLDVSSEDLPPAEPILVRLEKE